MCNVYIKALCYKNKYTDIISYTDFIFQLFLTTFRIIYVIVYQKALIPKFITSSVPQNNLVNFTTLKHKFRLFGLKKEF